MKYYRMLLKKPLRDFERLSSDVFLDNKKIKCAHISNGTPSVIFENGFCVGMSCMKYWDEAFLSLCNECSLFAYNRLDEEIAQKEIEDVHGYLEKYAKHLKSLLAKKEHKAPYVLVGHSLGGLYMQYFAKKYPDEVAGIVLVDAVYPYEKMKDNTIDKNIDKIGQAVLTMPSFGEKPMVILSATRTEDEESSCEKVHRVEDSINQQKAYGKLYAFAKQTWVESGHQIHYEKPDAIVDAVREVVTQI